MNEEEIKAMIAENEKLKAELDKVNKPVEQEEPKDIKPSQIVLTEEQFNALMNKGNTPAIPESYKTAESQFKKEEPVKQEEDRIIDFKSILF